MFENILFNSLKKETFQFFNHKFFVCVVWSICPINGSFLNSEHIYSELLWSKDACQDRCLRIEGNTVQIYNCGTRPETRLRKLDENCIRGWGSVILRQIIYHILNSNWISQSKIQIENTIKSSKIKTNERNILRDYFSTFRHYKELLSFFFSL